MSFEEYEAAKRYDKMIPWEPRLNREIPLIHEVFQTLPSNENLKILDLACASGRHSFALEQNGYVTLGLDKSEGMIQIANELKSEKNSKSTFDVKDIAEADFHKFLEQKGYDQKFKGAILLGNAIGNLEALERAKQMMQNVYKALVEGGKFFLQIIQRPDQPHYIALRKRGNSILQRIMIPVTGFEHNVELNFNVISFDQDDPQYEDQGLSPLYMFSTKEFEELCRDIGFKISEKYISYTKEDYVDRPGQSSLFILEK